MSSLPVSQVVYLVVSQVATKAVTFASNQLLLRKLSPEIFGIAAFIEFFINSILFFSREAVRVSCQRGKSESVVVRFAYLPLLLGVPILVVFSYLQTYSDLYRNTVSQLPHFKATATLILASIFLELLAEPYFAGSQHHLNLKLRSKAESIAVFMKCLTVFGLITFWQTYGSDSDFRGKAVASFACGQLCYSLTIFLVYWAGSGTPTKSKKDESNNYFDQNLLSIWKSLFLQMIFKHLLTEGDTMLISYLFTVTQQGVYSVIANYGSMAARLLFQPIEESIRVSFTKTLSQKDPDYTSTYRTMTRLLTFYFNLSLLVVVGGYTNGPFLLRFLLGRSEKWTQSSVFDDFPIYVLYIPFMAFNGILEAFFSSASTKSQIGHFSLFMSVSSVLVFALMYLFIGELGWGIRGLILANMANMLLRIVYCSVFYVRFFQDRVAAKSANMIQKVSVPLACSAAAMLVQHYLFESGFSSSVPEFAQSLLICVLCLVRMIAHEREQLREVALKMRKGRKGL